MAAKPKYTETSTEGTATKLRSTICDLDTKLYLARKELADTRGALERERATVSALQRECVRLNRALDEANDIPF